ncbi:hypothetical protein Rs2_41355 [Raphanus sativus]|nr:hypothetical protein Rs2_41355 [Raphanus sativus]
MIHVEAMLMNSTLVFLIDAQESPPVLGTLLTEIVADDCCGLKLGLRSGGEIDEMSVKKGGANQPNVIAQYWSLLPQVNLPFVKLLPQASYVWRLELILSHIQI